jgi:ubiquinone biosynthesis protein COQ9
MAKRATRRRAHPRPRRRAAQDPIDAALALAAERPWREVSLADIAQRAGTDEAALRRVHRSKAAIVAAFMRRIDEAVSAGTAPDADGEPVRDRLLDALLRRFDLLSPHKAAVGSIARDTLLMPPLALCAATRAVRSMARILEDAGVGGRGPIGLMRAKALTAIYASALWIWLRDDDPEMARTMAHLDRCLNEADRAARMCHGLGRPSARSA